MSARPKRARVPKAPPAGFFEGEWGDEEDGEQLHEEHEEPKKKPRQPKGKKAAADAASADKQGKKREKKEPPEKRCDEAGRTVAWRSAPSQAVNERIARAMPGSNHRLFLIHAQEPAPAAAGPRSQEFTVLGATGNVYTVKVCRQPHCTCPDNAKGNVCKHLLFIMLRVLKMHRTNPLIWQRALLSHEVEEVLGGAEQRGAAAAQLGGVLASEAVRAQYGRVSGVGAAAQGGKPQADDAKRKPVEGDCPVCCDELQEGGEPLVWCSTCGNNVHKGCFQMWANNKRGTAAGVTCVYCRAPWAEEGGGAAAGAGGSGAGGGYVNLAQHSEAHRNADTSLHALYPETAQWMEWRGGGRRYY